MNPQPVRTALISVYHKDGIIEFARELVSLGFKILASGGTCRHLVAAGTDAIDVSTLVGGGAILGHRVVTLSREVHAGLLARHIPSDEQEMADAKRPLPYIDLVCVDMYPLEDEIAKPGSTLESVIENTDIGGPTMIRSAAKGGRVVICDPADRQRVIDWLKAGQTDETLAEELAAKAEFIVAKYCMASANYRSRGKYLGFFGTKVADCAYGENRWQSPAAVYSSGTNRPLALDRFRVIEGTTPSFINYADVDRLLQTMTHIAAAFAKHSLGARRIAIGVKHGNACGAGEDILDAYVTDMMMTGDSLALFGGLVMTNFDITAECGAQLSSQKFDGIIAPKIDPEAIALLRRKHDKCRFIVNEALGSLNGGSLDTTLRIRQTSGGFLTEPNYTFVLDLAEPRIDRYGPPITASEAMDILFAWAIGSTSNSNTITLAKRGKLLSNAVNQQDRVGAAKLAVWRAQRSKHDINGAVAYSDSFFPQPDGPQALIDAGVKVIFTSSGSMNDKLTIDLCRKNDVSLLMIPDELGRGFYGH